MSVLIQPAEVVEDRLTKPEVEMQEHLTQPVEVVEDRLTKPSVKDCLTHPMAEGAGRLLRPAL